MRYTVFRHKSRQDGYNNRLIPQSLWCKRLLLLIALPLWYFFLMATTQAPANAFTQGSGIRGTGITPQGHEWITVRSALEMLGDERGDAPNDPRNASLPNGSPFPRAENTQLSQPLIDAFKQNRVDESTYGAKYQRVLAAVLGERWVDIGGFNVAKEQIGTNCFDAVAQLPDDVQHDHFCRMRGEAGGTGAVSGIKDSIARFTDYFVAAAIAPAGTIKAWDGGATSDKIEADRNYFLFGRAVHLFEDSFSEDHAVRFAEDGYKKVHGIKTYLCTLGSDQHSHTRPLAINYSVDYNEVGDVIWHSRNLDWTPANVKLNALTSVEGMKDAWAAFIRVMALPIEQREKAARIEAERVARTWLSFDPQEVKNRYDDPLAPQKIPTFVTDQAACDQMIGGVGIMDNINSDRAKCVFNIGPIDGTTELDRHLHIPYRWDWKNKLFGLPKLKDAPAGFNPTQVN